MQQRLSRARGGKVYMRRAMLAIGVMICAPPAFAQEAREATRRFEIPPGAAAEVVSAIADAGGGFVLFPYEALLHLRSGGVSGDYTVAEALEIALQGLDMDVRSTDFGVLTIVASGPEPEPETAPAPPAPPGIGPPPPPRVGRARALDPQDHILVTGTRITRPGMASPTPVTAISSAEIRQLSPAALIDAIEQLPQFVNNSTPRQVVGWTGSAGQSFLNLRSIGSNRTLVLIDGRRMVASTRRGAIDISLLPAGLVDRVEIITGGASAAYGSDAVAGVVNFILQKDLEGVSGHVQTGVSKHGDDRHREISLAAGLSLGARTHLLIAADAYGNSGVPNYLKRDWHRSWGVIRNPDPDGPTLITVPNVVSSAYSYGGLIPRGPLAGVHFLPDGSAAPFDYGLYNTPNLQIGGDGVDVGRERTLSPEMGRHTVFAYLSHQATPTMTLYGQALHGRTEAEFDKDPNYMAGNWEATIYADNAYLPEDVRARMIAEGLDSFPFARFASRRDLSVGRVNTVNNTLSLTAGLSGEIEDWRLNAYYQYGQNRQHLHLRNTVRVDRVYRAMDSVRDPDSGAIVCRSTLSFPDDGCIPTSFFGDGAVSDTAKQWLLDSNTLIQSLNQHIAEITVDGEPLDTRVGPVAVALGAAARYEDFRQYTTPYTPDQTTPPAAEAGYRGLPVFYSENYPLVERAVVDPSRGTAMVWELFAESIVPLVRERRLARSVDLQAALRFADYRGSGAIWAWKAGLDWRASGDLRLRGTLSRDVRGGALAERFDAAPRGVTGQDPFLEGEPVYAFSELESGNPAVSPERADTVTIGFVLQPRALPGFALSADYYDIRIRDAIARPGVQTIINGCFDGVEEMCELIRRSEAGTIVMVTNTYLNIDMARTRGFDIETSYTTPVSLFGRSGALDLRAIMAIYSEASLTPFGRPRQDFVGAAGSGAGLPDYRLLLSATYATGGVSLNVTGHYVSEGVYSQAFVEGVHIDDNRIEGVWYFNTRLGYEFPVRGGRMEAYLNVSNLFDSPPPIAPFGSGGFFGSSHAPSRYDPIGRRYTAGLAWRF